MWLWLIGHWRSRLARYHSVLADDPRDSQAWLYHVRVRILGFLMRRYGDGAAGAAVHRALPARATQMVYRPTLCLLDPSDDHAPRDRARLARTLRAIHRSNTESADRRRWRWW